MDKATLLSIHSSVHAAQIPSTSTFRSITTKIQGLRAACDSKLMESAHKLVAGTIDADEGVSQIMKAVEKRTLAGIYASMWARKCPVGKDEPSKACLEDDQKLLNDIITVTQGPETVAQETAPSSSA